MKSLLSKNKVVKAIKIDLHKCNGCRACEIACSAYHATPKYSSINPARSRIRVIMDVLNDEFVPIRASNLSKVGCDGRRTYTIMGKEYSECSFCGTVCSTRDLFKEPDSGLPLKCDMCVEEEVPLCVQACPAGCLVFEETEEVVEEIDLPEMEIGIKSLMEKYGEQKVATEIFARLTKKS